MSNSSCTLTQNFLVDRLEIFKEKTLEEPVKLAKTTERLGTDPLGKLILRLSLPSIVSMLAMSLYNLVDAFWVAKLGYQAVAAITVTLPYFIVISAIATGTGIGVNALVSRRFGERQVDKANHIAGQTFLLALCLGLLLVLVNFLFPRQILALCGATPDVIDVGEPYLRMIGLGMPLYLFSMISRNSFQASGDAVRPMFFVIISQVINAALAPCFIFGWGFFPELGIAGAGLATMLANAANTALYSGYILGGKTSYRIKLRHCIPDSRSIRDIYSIGLPAMCMQATEGIVFALFNHVIAGFGSVALAAIGIAVRISDLAFMPLMGTANGLLPIIGFSLGARLWDRLWGAVKLSSWGLAALMAVATVLMEVFPSQIVGIFSNDPELMEIAVPGMRIFMASLVVVGPTLIFITTFQGLAKGKDAMVLSLARQFIFFLPALYLLPNLWGITGIWIAMPLSDALGFVAASLWLIREYRLQKGSAYWTRKTKPLPVSVDQS